MIVCECYFYLDVYGTRDESEKFFKSYNRLGNVSEVAKRLGLGAVYRCEKCGAVVYADEFVDSYPVCNQSFINC